ncbi:hypothetical protein AVEN_265799-1 [Araneus ventricosus]|uniref:Uncharacterized protein n=1 Tax=Araneus ventricosus TaxID=182803 RepID=A0A4Y2RI18_ARAVE|nr:hypothetical protein AVEN_265799-1 [Araneus ventricosus]
MKKHLLAEFSDKVNGIELHKLMESIRMEPFETLSPDPRSEKPQISSAVRLTSRHGNRLARCRSGSCKGICGFPRGGRKKLNHQRREKEETRPVPLACCSLCSVLAS